MRRALLNTFFGLFACWYALLDRCLIVTAGMPVTGDIAFLIALQAGLFVVMLLLANGALPALAELASSSLNARVRLFAFAVPLLLFLASPVMISDSMYRARYGNLDKSVVHAHVGHDLGCCWNPF